MKKLTSGKDASRQQTFTTPDTLAARHCLGMENGDCFVICHLRAKGEPPSVDSTGIFLINRNGAELVRYFEWPIPQIKDAILHQDSLYCIDRHGRIYSYSKRKWHDLCCSTPPGFQINFLRSVDSEVYGIGDDGMIFLLKGEAWHPLTKPKKNLYLHDLCKTLEAELIVSGENGFLAQLLNGKFKPIKTTTKQDLTQLIGLPDGKLLVLGWSGTLFILLGSKLTSIKQSKKIDFLTATNWNGRTLIASQSGVLEYKTGKISEFLKAPTMDICSAGKTLWRIDYETCELSFLTGGESRWKTVKLEMQI